MSSPVSDTESITGAARDLAEHARRIARLELQLAMVETRGALRLFAVAAAAGVTGIALLGAGGAFLLAAIAAAIALALPTWAALLIVAGALFLTAALLLAVAALLVSRASPPVPSAAIEEARSVLHVVSGDGRG